MTIPVRVFVLGIMGRYPFGGQTWLCLHWLHGFQRLGYDVWYVEDGTTWPYDPIQNTVTDDCSYAVRHISSVLERVGLKDRWVYRLADRKGACWGIPEWQLEGLYRTCDILISFGAIDLREEHMVVPLRVYVESDPVFSELRLANGDEHTRKALAAHNAFFSYGENYGAPDCGVPLDGLSFKKTRQPVDLESWPYVFDAGACDFTTIGNYRHPGNDVVFNGETYTWSKHHEWEKFMELPRYTSQSFELALVVEDVADRDRLTARGWHLVSPFHMSLDVFGGYRNYIRRSRAEFTVAKDQNVRLRSGWFSERDAVYLASGKPVIAQDTAFGNILPTGQGLFAVSTIEEALAAVDSINADYERHCKAARDIAEEYFDSVKVVGRVLKDLGAA